jgi:glycosyltransferase involved in cell wall biosynthesis
VVGSLEIGLDRALPATLPTGSSTAILCAGACCHPEEEIQELWIVIDGVRHPPAAQRMPRAGRSGFWGIVPVRAPDRPGAIEVGVAARLADGRTEEARVGTIAVVERPEPLAVAASPEAARPLIAICMTTFDPDPELFQVQVESIRAQTDRDWVCLISDDHSEPTRFDEIRATVAGDERFVVSRSEERLGFYRNFERVLGLAPPAAGLIALCDHDDRWYPDKLASLRAALGEAGLAYSDARRVDRAGDLRASTLWRGRRPNHTNLASLLIANTIPGAACLFRREVVARALPFPDGPGWNFHDHWLAVVALASGDVEYVDRPLYDYVQHPGAVLGRVTTGPGAARERLGLRRRLERWRSAYFTGCLQVELYAAVLLARCEDDLTARKRRALRLLGSASRSLIAFAWLALRPLRGLAGRNETLGTESILVRGILWRRLVALYALGRRGPGGFADDLSVPSFEPHGLGARLRRWIAHADQPPEGPSSHA